MFEPSGVQLRLTAGCTYTCISHRIFQLTFSAVCGKAEAPKFECVLVTAVRLALSLHLLQQTPICAAYNRNKMICPARHGLLEDAKKSSSEGSDVSGFVCLAVLACRCT